MKRFVAACIAAAALGAGAGIVHSATTTTETADRIERRYQLTQPPPPPTAREVCNIHLDGSYRRGLAGIPAAKMCFEAVAAERGWYPETIQAWLPFAVTAEGSILHGESDWCWNRRGGDLVDDYCNITRYVGGEDTGWGQATCVLYCRNRGGILCINHGYCGSASILVSPYDSMKASVVLLIEDLGSKPWCFAEWAIQLHRCRVLPPDRGRY